MSNRTLLEFNHDYCPKDADLLEWAEKLRTYMSSGDKEYLPQGVEWKNMRHHSEPCPLDATRASLRSHGEK